MVKLSALHVVEIIGMCRAMPTKKYECVIHATRNGWLIRLVLIISIKHLCFPPILAIIRYSKRIRDQIFTYLNETNRVILGIKIF